MIRVGIHTLIIHADLPETGESDAWVQSHLQLIDEIVKDGIERLEADLQDDVRDCLKVELRIDGREEAVG